MPTKMEPQSSDDRSAKNGYPVVRTVTLSAPERRLLRNPRRDPGDIPVAGPHQVLVICADGEYYVEHGRYFRGTESIIANATSVSVVDTTVRKSARITIHLPSSDPGEGFNLSVGFSCTVDDPAVVVRHGLDDLAERLQAHLESYPIVTSLGTEFPPGDLEGVREVAAATLQAIQRLDPMIVPGMTVKMDSWGVQPSTEVVQDAQKRSKVTREEGLERHRMRERNRSAKAHMKRQEALRRKGPSALDDAYEASIAAESSSPAKASAQLRAERLQADETRYARRRQSIDDARQDAREHFEWRKEKELYHMQARTRLLDALAQDGAFKMLPPGPVMEFIEQEFGLQFDQPGALRGGRSEGWNGVGPSGDQDRADLDGEPEDSYWPFGEDPEDETTSTTYDPDDRDVTDDGS